MTGPKRLQSKRLGVAELGTSKTTTMATDLRLIMSKEINIDHRRAVAQLVLELRDKTKIDDQLYELLVAIYGKGSGHISQQIRKRMNDVLLRVGAEKHRIRNTKPNQDPGL